MSNSRSRRVQCAHDGCSKTFSRPHKAGRPKEYCSVECRTKAATARRAARGAGATSNDQVLRELETLTGQVADLINAAPRLTQTPAAAPPPTEMVDLAKKVRTACRDLRELTDYLAANPSSTQAIGIMNRTIGELDTEADRLLQASPPRDKNPG